MCSIIIIKYIHSSNTCGYFVKVVDVLDECIYFMLNKNAETSNHYKLLITLLDKVIFNK